MSITVGNIKEAHPAIYKRLLELTNIKYENIDDTDWILNLFPNTQTGSTEGVQFWRDIDDGNLQVFYDRYPEHAKDPVKFSIGEASPEAQKQFEANNPGMTLPTEPKAGDMVEGFLPRGEWIEGFYFTGGKSKDDNYIVQDWAGDLFEYYLIRLPQKSEVESKAKEILNKWYLPSSTTDAHNLEMAVSLIKWGQQNPDKK